MKDTQVDLSLSLGLHRSCTLVSIAEYIKKNDIASSWYRCTLMRCREKEITYINIYLIQRDYTSRVYYWQHTTIYRRGASTSNTGLRKHQIPEYRTQIWCWRNECDHIQRETLVESVCDTCNHIFWNNCLLWIVSLNDKKMCNILNIASASEKSYARER